MPTVSRVKPFMNTTRFSVGQFYADIVQDRRNPDIWIYVVQRHGSADVLYMGTCTSKEQCEELARRAIDELAQRSAAAG